MARAARRLASSASCRFFSLSSSLAATSVVGADSPALGVSSARRLADAASRGVRSAIDSLKRKRQRIVLGPQGLQIGVGDVLVPERRFGGGERRAGLIEIERVRVLRPGPPERHENEGDDGPVNEAQGGRRLHLKAMIVPGADSAARSLIHPTMAGPRRQPDRFRRPSGGRGRRPHANTVFTLRGKKGCAPPAALLKGALETFEGHPVTPTVEAPTFADSLSQAPRSAGERALDHFLAAGFERIEPAVLHPAALFLDMSGEEVRRRLFLTAGRLGRGDVPEAGIYDPRLPRLSRFGRAGADRRIFLSRPGVSRPRGPGRRADPDRARKFRPQATRKRRTRKCSRSASRRRRRREAATLAARLGDARPVRGRASIARGSRRLAAPSAPRRRPRARPRRHPEPAEPGRAAQAGVLAALESADHAGAKALVEDLLAIAGIEAVGGRSAGEIADRFLEQASLRSGEPIPAEKRAVLRGFPGDLRRSGRSGDRASAPGPVREPRPRGRARRLRNAQRLHRRPRGANRGDPLQRRLRARLRLLHRLRVRGARRHDAPGAKTALAGGRYDGLARRLGAGADIPAVGAAITLDRLANGETR